MRRLLFPPHPLTCAPLSASHVSCLVCLELLAQRPTASSHLCILPGDHLHLHHGCAVTLFHVITLNWNHLNLTAEQSKSPCLELCWPWRELQGKASEVNPLRTLNGRKNHFLSSSEASTQSDVQISVMRGSGWGQRGDLVCDENPHHLLLLKLDKKAFPRRTRQLFFTIVSSLGGMEPLIMFRWSGQTSGETKCP